MNVTTVRLEENVKKRLIKIKDAHGYKSNMEMLTYLINNEYRLMFPEEHFGVMNNHKIKEK